VGFRGSGFSGSEDRSQIVEVGSGTRRGPIGQDYAAAKDAKVGKKEKKVSFSIKPAVFLAGGAAET